MAQNFKQPGRQLTFLGSQIICPAVNNKPTAGDPVVVGAAIAGVAETTASATTDSVPINVVGVYNLSVVGNNGAPAAIAVGDKLFIDPVTAVVNSNAAKLYYGIALGAVGSGLTVKIDVRLGNLG